MKDNGFQVCCPSCETLFVVTDPELIGQIVACPKCGGMMMIEPPAESAPEHDAPNLSADSDSAAADENDAPFSTQNVVADASSDERGGKPTASAAPRASVDDAVAVKSEALELENEPDIGADVSGDERHASASRLPFIVSGVLCALGAALAFGFVKAYRSADVDADPPVVQTTDASESDDALRGSDENGAAVSPDLAADADVADSGDSDLLDDSPNLTVDGGLSDDSAPDFSATEGNDDVDVPLEPGDDAPDSNVSVTSEESDDGQTDSLVDDDALEMYADEDEYALSSDDLIVVADDYSEETESPSEDSDDESLTEEGAIPTEFDEAEFEKENQVQEEEKTESDEEDLGAVASTTDVSLQNLPVLRSEPKEIDVDARLALPIRSLIFPESPAAAVRLLSEFAAVPVELDMEHFVLMRPSLNMRLDLKVEDVDVAGALNKEAEMLKWNLRKEADRVVLEPLENDLTQIIEERFDVGDLLSTGTPFLKEIDGGDSDNNNGEENAEELLVRFIASLVDPEKWEQGEESAPASDISIDGSVLLITSDAATRKKVEIALEQLRVLRQLEPRAEMAPELLIPESRGWETLSKNTPFNLLKPTSLQQAMEILEGKFKFLILWDDASLNLAGVGRDSSTAARIESAPVEQIIDALLEPLKLTYLILDEKIILITTKERADSYKTIEIHGFSPVDTPKSLEESLKITEEMKSAVAPDSWNSPDVAIWLDPETDCWVIRQSQPIQREIRRWTNELLEKEKARNKKKAGKAARPMASDRVPEVASRTEE